MQSFLAPIVLVCLTGPAAAANSPDLIGSRASKERLELGNRAGVWNGFTWRIEGTRLIVDKPDGTSEGHYLDDQGRLVLPAGLGTARNVN